MLINSVPKLELAGCMNQRMGIKLSGGHPLKQLRIKDTSTAARQSSVGIIRYQVRSID